MVTLLVQYWSDILVFELLSGKKKIPIKACGYCTGNEIVKKMPSRQQKKRAKRREQYLKNQEAYKARARARYREEAEVVRRWTKYEAEGARVSVTLGPTCRPRPTRGQSDYHTLHGMLKSTRLRSGLRLLSSLTAVAVGLDMVTMASSSGFSTIRVVVKRSYSCVASAGCIRTCVLIIIVDCLEPGTI